MLQPTPSRGFRPSDLATFVDVTAADFSAVSGAVVYTANTHDRATALESTALWLRTPDGATGVLAPSTSAQVAPVIAPDGSVTAFHQLEDDRFQLRVVDHESGEVTELARFERGTSPIAPSWSPDGRQLACVASNERRRDPSLPYLVERPLWRLDGVGPIDDATGEIWLVDAAGGGRRQMTANGGLILRLHWSADGTQILYSTIAEPASKNYTVRILDVASSESRVILEGPFLGYPPVANWLPDGRVIYASPLIVSNARDLHTYDPATDAHEALGVEFAGQLFGGLEPGMSSALLGSRILAHDSGEKVFVSVQSGGRVDTVEVSLTRPASARVVAGTEASTYPIAASGDSLLLAKMTTSTPLELYLHRVGKGEKRVSDINRSRHAHGPFTVHSFRFDSSDGAPVEAWFLEPRGGSAPYPTVVRSHGGPFAGVGQAYSVDDAVLTSAGYGVLLVNFRGSSGYGEEFAAPLTGAWGGQDAADVLAGLDAAIARGWVDAERTAAFGLSGGGFLVSWLLTHSDAFRAGVTECGISDWNSMLGSDIHEMVTLWMGNRAGTGPDSMAAYVRASPLTYAASCTAPVLIIEHEDDLRCPAVQGDILYNVLHQAGTEVAMLRMPGMSHGAVFEVGGLASRIARLEAILDWLGKHV